MVPVELGKYGDVGIALACLSLVGWLVNRFLATLSNMESKHAASTIQLKDAIAGNTEVSRQTYEYLKLRNGSLDKTLTDISRRLESVEHVK